MKKTLIVAAAALALVVGVSAPSEAATVPSKTGDFFVGFNTTTPTGGVNKAYAGYWQPYPDGMSGKYYSNQVTSIRDGKLDIYIHDKKGAAGTFGTPTGAWNHKGGTFSIRMRTRDGAKDGLAVMLWPTSDNWNDGELDFPEGNLAGNAHIYHHLMPPNDPSKSMNKDTGVKMSDWHTYSMVWVPGKSVSYYIDDKLQTTVTSNVPTSVHRFMIQTSNNGTGHVYIDWVRTTVAK